MSLNRVIGKDNDIPWRIPEDWRWVSKMTRGGVVIMGRRTFQSIGRPLADRDNIVVSRTMEETAGVRVVRDIGALESIVSDKQIWIFGGAGIYEQALKYCSDLYLTVVNRIVDGDRYFPEFEEDFDFKCFLRREEEFLIKHYVRHNRS